MALESFSSSGSAHSVLQVGPTPAGNRIVALDVLRGFALLAIAIYLLQVMLSFLMGPSFPIWSSRMAMEKHDLWSASANADQLGPQMLPKKVPDHCCPKNS